MTGVIENHTWRSIVVVGMLRVRSDRMIMMSIGWYPYYTCVRTNTLKLKLNKGIVPK